MDSYAGWLVPPLAGAGTLAVSMPDLRRAYALAREVVQRGQDLLGSSAGHRLVWVRAASRRSAEPFRQAVLFARPEVYLVAGQHEQCGLRIDDPTVALRHLLIRSVVAPSGGSVLRILDLHTGVGFRLSDGSLQTSVVAEGPVALGFGESALVALPPERPDDQLPRELPAPELAPPGVDPGAELGPYRRNARPNRMSLITLMPRLVMLGEPVPLSRPTGGMRWEISLTRDQRRATVTVSEGDLVGGVLIGRSEACHAEALRRVTDRGTSRAHLLLVREGPDVFAYDLASTQGTFQHRRPIRRLGLGDRADLVLGRVVELAWRRVA